MDFVNKINMKEKIKLIDKITKYHPLEGVEEGYSEYTGGMKDSGRWFFRKMIDVPIEKLELFLANLVYKKNKPKEILTPQELEDSKTIHQLSNGQWITELERKRLEDFNMKTVKSILFLYN